MLNLIFTVVLIAAIVLVIVTVVLSVNAGRKKAAYRECEGTIIRFYENSAEAVLSSYEQVAVSPVVEYQVDGKRYEFIGNYYSTSMKVGDKIGVLYDSADFSKAVIKKGMNFAPMITGALAVVFLIIAGVFFTLKSKGLF